MKLALFAALLSSSAIVAAQEIPDTTPIQVPQPQELPAPSQPTIPPDVPDQPIMAPEPAQPTDSVAPAAKQALEARKSNPNGVGRAVEPVRRANSATQRVAEPGAQITTNDESVPGAEVVTAPAGEIAAQDTVPAEPVIAAPVDTNTSSQTNDNNAENWLLALAGLGILGIAGGAGVAMTRRRKPVNAGAPISVERMDRPAGNKAPIATKSPRVDVAEPINPAREPLVHRQPVQPQVVERTVSAPVSDIPIVDPMFAAKAELPPITDPLFANHPDFVGHKPTFKGFSLNTGASWSEPRRVEPAEKLDQPVN